MQRRGLTAKLLTPALPLLVLCILAGCGDQRTVSQLPETHPASWMETGSLDFHGRVALANGTASCAVCHGADFLGGKVDISCIGCHASSGACTSCHGGQDNNSGAPPQGLRGETSTTSLAVGAHTTHVEGTGQSRAVPCEYCHLVPATMLEPYHLDLDSLGGSQIDSVAELTWGGFADGGAANWDRASAQCSNTYCHGNFIGGNTANHPLWTGSDQAECGSCHDAGDDPATLGYIHQLHLTDSALVCADCHASTVDSNLQIIAANLHVNGQIETNTPSQETCDRCHGFAPDACVTCHGGTDNLTGAPPRGLRGETTATQRAVGAHTTHLEGSWISNGFECSECHLVPDRLTDPGHYELDSIAEMNWGTLAGGSSQWNRTSNECSNTYCHGNFSGGYIGNRPIWTAPGQAACGSCHDNGSNPDNLSGEHREHIYEGIFCDQCHATTIDTFGNIIGRDIHVDGVKTVSFLRPAVIWQNGRCSSTGCHGPEDW